MGRGFGGCFGIRGANGHGIGWGDGIGNGKGRGTGGNVIARRNPGLGIGRGVAAPFLQQGSAGIEAEGGVVGIGSAGTSGIGVLSSPGTAAPVGAAPWTTPCLKLQARNGSSGWNRGGSQKRQRQLPDLIGGREGGDAIGVHRHRALVGLGRINAAGEAGSRRIQNSAIITIPMDPG